MTESFQCKETAPVCLQLYFSPHCYSPQVASIPLQTLQELHILVFIIIEKGPQIKNIQLGERLCLSSLLNI